MKLADLFKRPQLVSLLGESDTQIALGLQDPRTGAATQVTITADMAVLPDEALLSVHAVDQHLDVDIARWWEEPDVIAPEVPQVFVRCEPEPTWMVTPGGEHVDLREHAGGLF